MPALLGAWLRDAISGPQQPEQPAMPEAVTPARSTLDQMSPLRSQPTQTEKPYVPYPSGAGVRS